MNLPWLFPTKYSLELRTSLIILTADINLSHSAENSNCLGILFTYIAKGQISTNEQ
jgi:hypothetical protein